MVENEVKFGEGGSRAEQFMQKASEAAGGLREEATRELTAGIFLEPGHPDAPIHRAIGKAFMDAAIKIEQAITTLKLEVESALQPKHQP